MSMSRGIRTFHRWTSIVFILGVITYTVWMQKETPPAWVGGLAGLPLVLLAITGLYMFFLPYFRRQPG
jgi:hypothetical protein